MNNRKTKLSDVLSPNFMSGALGIMAYNKLEKETLPHLEIDKVWKVRGWRISFRWRSKQKFMGRFGGGWNWAVGFKAGGKSVNLHLLVCSLMISRPRRKEETS